MTVRSGDDVPVRYHLKRLHKIEHRLGEVLIAPGSSLGSKRCLPRSPLSAHRGAAIQAGSMIGEFPLARVVRSRAHPNPDDARKEAYRSSATVRFGQQNNKH